MITQEQAIEIFYLSSELEWTNSPDDQHYLADGLVYLNPEDGAARAKAMLIWEKVE